MSQRNRRGGHPAQARRDAKASGAAKQADRGQPDTGAAASAGGANHAGRSDARPSLPVQIAILAAVFLATTLIAELAGAANLGVAIGIGQIAFAIALVAMLLLGP